MASSLAIPADRAEGGQLDQLSSPSGLSCPVGPRDAFASPTPASSTPTASPQHAGIPNETLVDAHNQHLAYLQALPQNFARMVQLAANGALGPAAMALCRNYVDALHQSVSSAGKPSDSNQATAGAGANNKDSSVSAACSNLFSLVSTLSNPFVLNALNTSGASTTSAVGSGLPPPSPAVGKDAMINNGPTQKRTYTEMESAYNFDTSEDAIFDRFRAYAIRRNSRDVMLQDLSELSALVTWDRADARHHNFYYYQGKNCSSAATRHPELPQFGVKSTLARSCVACLVLKSTAPAAATAVSPAVNVETSLKRAKGANGSALPSTSFASFGFSGPEVTTVQWGGQTQAQAQHTTPSAPATGFESLKTPVFHEVLTDARPPLSRPARPSTSISAPNLSAMYHETKSDSEFTDEYLPRPSSSSSFSSSSSLNPGIANGNGYNTGYYPSRHGAPQQQYTQNDEPKQRKVRSETPEMMQLKAQTRDALARLNLNQSALARALNIKQSYISRWLHNKHTPGMEDQIVAPIREWLNSKAVTSLLPGGLSTPAVASSPSRTPTQYPTQVILQQQQQQQQYHSSYSGSAFAPSSSSMSYAPAANNHAAQPVRRSPPAFSSASNTPRPPALSAISLSSKPSLASMGAISGVSMGTTVGISPMLLTAAQAPATAPAMAESAASQSQSAVAASTLSTPSSPVTPPSPSAPLSAPTSISSSAGASPLASFAACRPASTGLTSALFKSEGPPVRTQAPSSSLIFSTVGSLTASTRGALGSSRLAAAARPVPIISAVRGNVSARSLTSLSTSTSPLTLSSQIPSTSTAPPTMAVPVTASIALPVPATAALSAPAAARSTLFSKPSY